jgi:hypothetical protein
MLARMVAFSPSLKDCRCGFDAGSLGVVATDSDFAGDFFAGFSCLAERRDFDLEASLLLRLRFFLLSLMMS